MFNVVWQLPVGRGFRLSTCYCGPTCTLLKRDDNSTRCSQAVTHPSTDQAQHCLTSVIRRELVCSMWCGRCLWRSALDSLFVKTERLLDGEIE